MSLSCLPTSAALVPDAVVGQLDDPQTQTEKIEDNFVKSGNYVTISPHHCISHNNSWLVALKFMSIGATKVKDPHQVVMTFDHDIQIKGQGNWTKYRQIDEFAK
ncbi:hypothetical protein DV737_g3902, partial [Chaetothyriales sp. CBS 132003]